MFSFRKSLYILLITIFVINTVSINQGYTKDVFPDRTLIIGTGDITGIYYPIGATICRMLHKVSKSNNVRCLIEPSTGSFANLENLQKKDIDIGFVQSDLEYEAFNGTNQFQNIGGNQSLRSILSLYEEVYTVIVKANSHIKNFEDIKGQRINLGTIGSSDRAIMSTLMDIYGWKNTDFQEILELKPSEQAEALCNDTIDVMIYSVGHPNAAVRETSLLCDTKIIPVVGPKIDEWLKKHPYYVPTTIKGGFYAGNPNDIQTFGVKATILTRKDVDEDIIYNIVKSIFSSFESFKGAHPVLDYLTPAKMINDCNIIPLHEGAKRYYEEKKLLDPLAVKQEI